MCKCGISAKRIDVDVVFYVCGTEQGTGPDRFVLAQLTQLYMTVKLECPFYEVKCLK